jgi:thiamine pyrophosphokinase
MEQPQEPNLIKLPRVKDMTDCEAAIDLAASQGYTDLTVLGGLGGRFDHTMGNIAMLKKYLDKALSIRLMDGQNLVFLRGPGRLSVAACGYTYLGLIAYDSPCTGLSLRGTKYTLTDYTLTNDTSLCVSNEIIGGTAEISFCSGTLLVILSRDRG